MLCAGSVCAWAENAVDTVLNTKTTQAFSQESVSEEDLNTIVLAGANHDALCEKLGVDPALTAVDGATGASVRSTLDEKVSFIK